VLQSQHIVVQVHNNDVLKEVDRFKRMESGLDELESTEMVSNVNVSVAQWGQ
jgi:hypothetical protein